jgi:nitric oxide reductase NorD protein
MSEPEEVILEAAHSALVRIAPRFRPARPELHEPGLADLHRRLGLFLEAMCPGAPRIVAAEPPAVPTWMGRVMARLPAHGIERRALPSTDGSRLRLPPRLDAFVALPSARVYRVIALGLALRARRGAAAERARLTSRAAADLLAVAEAVSAERELSRLAPGLVADLDRLREIMLAARPSPRLLNAGERAVEARIRDALGPSSRDNAQALPEFSTAEASRAWAEERARALEAAAYRGLPAVFLWGVIEPARGVLAPVMLEHDESARPVAPPRAQQLPRRPRVRPERPGEDDEGPGLAMMPIEDRQESVEDPLGLQRPLDRDDHADPEGLADSVSELPELRVMSTPGTPREMLISDDPDERRARQSRPALAEAGLAYPEWSWREGHYRIPGARVRTIPAPSGADAWWRQALRDHAPLVRRTRRRFERLRSRRIPVPRQLDGPDLDMSACVEAWSDARGGRIVEDRLYVATRPHRRDLALVLLVDVSASTDAWVEGRRRIVDVEKEALLVISEGLEALGDRFAILAFSGESAARVEITEVRGFAGSDPLAVRRAIAGLEPSGYTRLGAAIRHASSCLLAQPVRHRLLMVMSDGRPNDVDEYEGRYGVEDTRMAVLEARQDGLLPLCLTVDRDSASYLPRIFGIGGSTRLRRVERLPEVLASVLQRVLAS